MIKFGTDGWRGIIGEDFTFDNLKIVSQAVADLLNKEGAKKIVIGYDTRFLSREFALAVASVITGNGIKVVFSSKIVPTPVISFTTKRGNFDLGIMITASHNPYKFNGFKIKTREGAAADKTLTDKVEKYIGKRKIKVLDIEKAKKKNLFLEQDLTIDYKNFLRKFVDINRIRKLKLKVLVDLMYGAGDEFLKDILCSSDIKIDYLHKEYNPSFGGIHPEPTEDNLKMLIEKVKKDGYHLGLALDGDADRLALVTEKGRFINAQIILPLLAIHMIKNRNHSLGIGKTVVGTNLIDVVAMDLGVSCFETPVGFKHISNLFKQDLICIGGEEAGGIGFKGYIPERDGTASFLMVLEMMAYQKKLLGDLIDDLEKNYGRWYYRRTSFGLKNLKKDLNRIKIPTRLLGKPVERVNRLDGIKIITKDSWLMFRKSGTEPIVRVYSEAKSKKERDSLINLGERIIHAL